LAGGFSVQPPAPLAAAEMRCNDEIKEAYKWAILNNLFILTFIQSHYYYSTDFPKVRDCIELAFFNTFNIAEDYSALRFN